MLMLGTFMWLLAIGLLVWFDELRTLQYLAFILPTYLIRLEIFGIPTTWLELAIYAIVVVWIIKRIGRKKRFSDWWQPLVPYKWPLFCILVGLIVGLVVSSDKMISAGILKGWWFDPLLIFVLITNTRKDYPEVEFSNVVFGLWCSGVVLALAALWQVVTGQFITPDQRASAWFTSANYLSLYLVPIMILVLGWWNAAKGCGRWLIAGGWLAMAAGLYFSASYAGWLALLVGLGVFWWLTFPSWKLLVSGSAGLVLAILSQWQSPKFHQLWDVVGRSSSHVRIQVWQTAWLMLKENWLTGIGLGLFEKRYLSFAERLFHPPLEPVVLHAHNFWVQSWLYLGVVGFMGMIAWLWQWVTGLWPVVRTVNFKAVAIFSAMAALLTHGLVDTPYWKNDLAALFWIIMALGVLFIRSYGRKNLPDRY